MHTHFLFTLFADEETEAQSHTPPRATQLGTIRIPDLCSFPPTPTPQQYIRWKLPPEGRPG